MSFCDKMEMSFFVNKTSSAISENVPIFSIYAVINHTESKGKFSLIFACILHTMGPACNQFGYYKHPAITSNFFSQ